MGEEHTSNPDLDLSWSLITLRYLWIVLTAGNDWSTTDIEHR